MTCTVSRLGLATLILTLAAFGTTMAGDLFRPVPPDAQVTRFTRFNIRYTLRDVVADGVEKVEFYITEDMGRTWRLYGEDVDKTSPMTIQVPGEGVYGFVCVATDRFGNREREPSPRSRPESVIVVDRTPPQAKWIAPLQDVLARTGGVEFSWETSDPYFGSGPVRLQYAVNAASNHDRNAAWQTMQENLPAVGKYTWVPPAETAGKYNFRLLAEDRAGNITVAYNPSTMVVDSTHPQIVSVSPLKSNRLDVDIYVQADDGVDGSGVKSISLYTSANAGILWDLVKETNEARESVPLMRAPGEPIPFKAERPGEYCLWPIAFDMADNATPMPPQGLTGPYVLVIDNEPPSVTVSNSFLQGRGAILANETRIVEWTSYDPHPANGGGALSLSLDNGNTWQVISSGLSSSGSTVVNFPFGSTSEEAMLKIEVTDDFGNTGEGLSQRFNLSAADTMITSVTPVGGQPGYYDQGSPTYTPPTGGSSFGFPQDEYGTQPPMIPPPPQTSFPATPPPATGGTYYDATSPYPASDPYATGMSPTYTPPTVSDPYAGATYGSPYPDPYGSTYVPPTASDPYTTTYTPPTATDLYAGIGADESTAGTFPSAMLSGTQQPTAPTTQAPSSVYVPAAPSTATSQPGGIVDWNPTPATGSGSQPGASTGLGVPPPAATATTPEPSFPVLAPPAETAAPAVPVAPPASSQTASPASTTTDPFSSFQDGTSTQLAPPPLVGGGITSADGGISMPSFSFDDFGSGGLTPPPLPSDSGQSSFTAPAPAVSAPSGAPSLSSTEPLPTPSLPVPVQPPAVAAPQTAAVPQTAMPPAFDSQPSEVAPIQGLDSAAFDDQLRPPPMAPSGGLPTDPRQLSTHYANEARDYLDEGRLDLALDSATKALNADNNNALAYSRLAQVYVQQDPPNFPRAATLAREATNLGRDWYSWWTCSDVFYRWSHARNRMVQSQIRSGQRPSPDLLDERNQALNNAQIAVGNAARLVQSGTEADREQVAMTQGEITYLRALSIPEPVKPAAGAPATAQDEYRRALSTYKASVSPILSEALPYFQTAMQLGGSPSYREAFHMGIINFRLGGLEKDTGNAQQAARHYQVAAEFLEEATIATQVPAEGPREAYYMLAYCHDQLAEQPGADRSRHKEMALRYWRRTAEFYSPGSAYREYAEQRIIALQHELGL